MLHPDDVEAWMLKLAEAADSDAHNQVYVMRDVLTKAYRRGFDDGLHAAGRDDFVRRQIEQRAAESDGDSDV